MTDIITRYDPPPIPDRQFDWQAYHKADHDNYDGQTNFRAGWGRTEAEAIADLARLDEELADWEESRHELDD